MRVTWVCTNCSSNNTCEESEEMVCFVCGKRRTEEAIICSGRTVSTRTSSAEAAPVKDRLGFAERIKHFFASFGSASPAIAAGSEHTRITDWKIERGPDTSKEAYITATPIYAEAPTPAEVAAPRPMYRAPVPTSDPVTRATVERPAVAEHESMVDRAFEVPWPEHRVRVCEDRLHGTGCVRMERAELNGVKGYKLQYRNGTERFMPAANMKLLGYFQDR